MAQISGANCPQFGFCNVGCCEWTVTNNDASPSTFNYTDCDGNSAGIFLLVGETSQPFCGLGLVIIEDNPFELTYIGCCSDCQCYDGLTAGQYSYWDCNGIVQSGNSFDNPICYNHYLPFSGITSLSISEVCDCISTGTTPTTTPTPIPTSTPIPCSCYSLTYSLMEPDLYVRYKDCSTGIVVDTKIVDLFTVDNDNGSYTAYICVDNSGLYPTCVLDGLTVSCFPDEFVIGGPCDTEIDCTTIDVTPIPTLTPTIFCDSSYCNTTGNCCQWIVQNDGPTANYDYTDCDGNPASITVIGGTLSAPFCAINPPYDTQFFEPIPQGCCSNSTTPTPTPTKPSTTPTPTPTKPSTTPTPTPTKPSGTPTPTPTSALLVTPTPTPTSILVVTPTINISRNDCEILTIFPMGIECFVISQPTGINEFDGVLSIKVTGGTAPYTYYWSDVQGTNIKSGLLPGDYPITVIDFYGDYTANTICSLFAPTPTPTLTSTIPLTPTPTFDCQTICIYSFGFFVSYGPWLFNCNGNFNTKGTWQYIDEEEEITYNITWIPSRNRWEVVGEDMITPIIFDSGIMVNTSSSDLPISSWQFFGGPGSPPQILAKTGECPETLPLTLTLNTQNVSCLSNNGSIIATALYGSSPYQYSINNGPYGSNNVFNGLNPGTYTIKVKDFANTIVTKIATIVNTQTPTSYIISLVNLGSNIITPGANQSQQTCNYRVNVSPPISSGTTISFNINLAYQVDNNSPWTNNDPNQTAEYEIITNLAKNGTNISPLNPTTLSTSTTNRPDCSPNETYKEFSGQTATNVQMTVGDNVTGSTVVLLNIFAPQVDENGCQSQLNSRVTITLNSIQISGCACCSVNPTTSELQYEQYVTGYLT